MPRAVSESVLRAEERLAKAVLDPIGAESRKLGNRKPSKAFGLNKKMARPGRFERPTSGSGDQRSIQLSYGRAAALFET